MSCEKRSLDFGWYCSTRKWELEFAAHLTRNSQQCFFPFSYPGMYLKRLIIEHHTFQTVIPKHHFMIHYQACRRQIRPLLHMWRMRFEAKHLLFNTLKNFKNIAKSLAKKHKFAIGHHWETSPLWHTEYGLMKAFPWVILLVVMSWQRHFRSLCRKPFTLPAGVRWMLRSTERDC